jgi:hypothetical protein
MSNRLGRCGRVRRGLAAPSFAIALITANGGLGVGSASARAILSDAHAEAPRQRVECDALTGLKLAATEITSAAAISANTFVPPHRNDGKAVPIAFCRVTGVIRPTADSDIRFEVWLPQTGWSGRYESVGNGGFAGAIRYDSMWNPLLGGSAVASTDDGHSAPAVGLGSAKWAMGHPEKIADYGYRAVHLTAEAGKAVAAAYYGRRPQFSYFVGCSKGGQEAFMEAQRYPNDFNGIIAGAAANQWVNLFASFPWTARLNLQNRASYVSPSALDSVARTVQRDCDAQDGVQDGLISDPLRCHIDLRSTGLTPSQIGTFTKIHEGPKSSSGAQIYAGHPYGTETVELPQTIAGKSYETAASEIDMGMYGNEFFRYFVYRDPSWTFRNFQIDRARADAQAAVGDAMNSNSLNFSRFRARGGKIIQWNGWADGIVTPLGAISYYRRIVDTQNLSKDRSVAASARALAKTQAFDRLFLAPGVGHCSGGPGPHAFGQAGGNGDADHDMVSALERWVEKGKAPQKIIATKYVNDDPAKDVIMTRPLCPYPQVAIHDKSGDVSRAESFICKSMPML